MRRLAALIVLLAALGACGSPAPYADDATVAAVSYRDPGPPALTLYTMINNRTGAGGHTGLLISASERVLFDPAGSFHHDAVPERNDVLFGMTPQMVRAYESAHARSTHHVVRQTVHVTPAQAEAAYRLALAAGPVPGAFCANATTALLAEIPGFGWVSRTFYPEKLMRQFEARPEVVTERYRETDEGDLRDALVRGL